jgi:hypothetical protein
MNSVLGRLRRWFGQDVARVNAAQASVRLKHARREQRDLEAYLDQQVDPVARLGVEKDRRDRGRGAT